MFKSHLLKIRRFYWLLLLPLIAGVFITSCGESPVNSDTNFTDSSAVNTNINFVPENFTAVGDIQGTVIDKATGEGLSGITITLFFNPAEADEPSVLTDTTGNKGHFAFTGVPVNSDGAEDFNSGQENSPYTLEITTENLDNYRDLYRFNAPLTFEGTGGAGAATNLVSDVTIPLSELSVKVKGELQTTGGIILPDVKVKLYQQFNPIINGNNNTQTNMLLDSAMTGDNGGFTFTNIEEDARISLEFIDKSDPSNVVRDQAGTFTTESASGDATPVLDLGVIQTFTRNESGTFYVTNVTPQPDSDVSPDTMFVYEFNRPVAENEYTRTDLGFGNGTFKDDIAFSDNGPKKAPGDVEFNVSFSSNRDSLIIDPEGLIDANRYTLFVSSAFNDQDFVDEHGNNLAYPGDAPYTPGEIESLDFSTNANNAKPHTPTLAAEASTIIDYNSGTADLSWGVDESSADVKLYEIWRKIGDDPYERLTTLDRDNITFNEVEATYVVNHTNRLVLLRGFGNDTPEEAITHKVKVRAISNNLRHGDFSNEITIADTTKPDVTAASYNGGTGELTVEFDEPMNKAQVENASNYSFEDSGGSSISANIESVEYSADYGSSPATESYEVVITVEDPTSLSSGAGETVIVDPVVTDLAGNGMDTDDANNDNDGNENEATY